ncbi:MULTISPECIES: ATP-binding protein [unclassified Spirosoma]|uniref:ATP-binding protein n=1 Tax=unclassified Spirosoma TaxID=2621999 RepID=UPI00096A14A2|nr:MULTISPECIES: ATP-binding protein [unclassified Spirosoma]MBN8821208.1 PAS domain S-box protein [Spirosoma sp.]OJW79165.1 MAG: histidine kinase [Spirosoma sp. 48-14]
MITPPNTAETDFLAGGGETAALIRTFNWAETPLGPIDQWPQSLKTATNLMLNTRQPVWIGWGPKATFLYNDAYIPVLSLAKHPWALGKPAATVWEEIWDFCGPLASKVFQQGESSFVDDVRLFMNRGGFLEETFYSFSYSPIRDETGQVTGLFCPNTEVTAQNLNTRRLATLSALASNVLTERTTRSACASAAQTIYQNPDDIPFALLYLTHADTKALYLEQAVRLPAYNGHFSTSIANLNGSTSYPLNLPLMDVVEQGKAIVSSWTNSEGLSPGPAGQPITQAMVLPLIAPGTQKTIGLLVAGVNPTRPLDANYRTFYELVANQVATAIQQSQAAEEERQRIEQLAELNKAKSLFFSNISHELRTPLTLILGPLEELLQDVNHPLPIHQQTQVEATHRNAQRLLRLVNTLLDFSRLESGRLQATFTPTDLSTFTTDLASNFRSVIEKAGMQLVVDAEPLPELVDVDRNMWEKIVLNLLSNAFKFTLKGTITVRLVNLPNNRIRLTVNDTGVGIPAADLPRLFERFHRVEGSQGRSFEGTGIGLALVHELVELHGGTIQVSSELDRGSTFCVQIPVHQARQSIAPEQASTGSASLFVADANLMLPTVPDNQSTTNEPSPSITDHNTKRILLADDNADMRAYIHRLLSPHYTIDTVTDGREALEAIQRRQPDLLLSDIMMPNLDGTELLKILKQNPQTAHIPVMLLSARAGEESTLNGYAAGADDYLTKPFSANELLVRVQSQLKLAQARQETQQKLRHLFRQAPVAIAIVEGPQHIFTLANDLYLALTDRQENQLVGHSFPNVFPELIAQGVGLVLNQVFQSGEPFTVAEQPVELIRHGQLSTGYYSYSFQPLTDSVGQITGIIMVAYEVTESVKARLQLEESQRQFKQLADLIPQIVWTARPDGTSDYYNQQWYIYTGLEKDTYGNEGWLHVIHPDDQKRCLDLWSNSIRTGEPFQMEYRFADHRQPGQYRWFLGRSVPVRDSEGTIVKWFGSATDINDQKQAEAILRQSEIRFRSIADTAPVLIWISGVDKQYTFFNKGWLDYTGRTMDQEIGNGWSQGVHPDDFQRCMNTYTTSFDARQEFYMDYRLRRHDGEYRWVAERGKPWFDPNGTFMGYIGGCTDIHDSKVANEVLERRVADRTRELKNLNMELERSNLDLMQFASVASHDLKEPLRKIQAFSTLLLASLDSKLEPSEQDHFIRIVRAAARMQTLVDDVLRLSKLSRLDAQFESVNLNAIIARIQDDLEITIQDKEALIEVGNLPIIDGIPGQLHQLFQNLISNALKFVSNHTPQVTIESCPITDQMRTEFGLSDHDYTAINVTDNGIGFDMQYVEKIFGMFQRLHRRETYEGTGIGLTICRRIVENHHGYIRAFSRPGEGATFQIILPVHQIHNFVSN